MYFYYATCEYEIVRICLDLLIGIQIDKGYIGEEEEEIKAIFISRFDLN